MTKKFDTKIIVRPHEIDYNQHVHQSVYLDYLLYARVDQMERCYKMPIEEFFKRGLSWATKSLSINYLQPLFMNEKVVVRTWIEEIKQTSVRVSFQYLRDQNKVISADGQAVFVLINARSGKPERIPDDIRNQYMI